MVEARVGRGRWEFSLAPLRPGDSVIYSFNTHDLSGSLTYQNIDLVMRGQKNQRSYGTQFLHSRGARRGAVTLGRGEHS